MLKRWWPILVLVGVEIALAISNIKLNTWLLGWDSTQPELNFKLNLVRDLTGLWQYYRGLGVLDGMAHVANIMHVLYAWVLSLIVGKMYVRYVYIFLMHLLGGVGIYILVQYLFQPKRQALALFGALFYMLNPYTLQMFYQPLELFVTHYASLPWLIWGVIRYMRKPESKRLKQLALLSFIFTPQAHVPTLFIVLSFLYFILLVTFLLSKRGNIQVVMRVIAVIFVTNAFWGLPYIYSALSNAQDISQSKINRLSNPEIRLRNDAYGDFNSVIRMRGFGLTYEDWHKRNPVGLQMPQWQDWWDRPEIKISLYILTGVGLVGLVAMLLGKWHWWGVGFALMYLFALGNLGIRISGIGMIGRLLREFVPYYGDIFRFTFTKFSLMYAFLLSLGLVSGIQLIPWKRIRDFVALIFMGTLIWIALPAFKGDFLYWELRIQMPQEYMDAMRIINKAPFGRVLYLPQPTIWGWVNHTWGYRGSGFIWQGVRDPMLYPAFNAWSVYNEGFSNQLLNTVYACDLPKILGTKQVPEKCIQNLNSVLRKYDVEYVLIDRSVFVPGKSEYTTGAQAIELILSRIGEKLWGEGVLTLWHMHSEETNQYVWALGPINPKIPDDLLYKQYGPYIELWNLPKLPQSPQGNMNTSIITCPLVDITNQANLEYRRTSPDIGWVAVKSEGYEEKYAQMLAKASALRMADITEWPAQIQAYRRDEKLVLSINMGIPGVWAEHWYSSPQVGIGTILLDESKGKLSDVFVDKSWYDVQDIGVNTSELGYQELSLRDTHTIQTVTDIIANHGDQKAIDTYTLKLQLHHITPPPVSDENASSMEIWFPLRDMNVVPQRAKLGAVKNCDTFEKGGVATSISPTEGIKYKAWDGGVNCDYSLFDDYKVPGGYFLILEGENLQGRSLKIYLRKREYESQVLLEELLPKGKFQVVYPVEINFPGDMELDMETRAFGKIQSENVLRKIQLVPTAWKYFQNICLEVPYEGLPNIHSASSRGKELFPGFYSVKVTPRGAHATNLEVISVSQAFAPGWIAYKLDFAGTHALPSIHKLLHVRVNGWKNGWLLEPRLADMPNETQPSTIFVFYWPELISLSLIPVSLGIPLFWTCSLLKDALKGKGLSRGNPDNP